MHKRIFSLLEINFLPKEGLHLDCVELLQQHTHSTPEFWAAIKAREMPNLIKLLGLHCTYPNCSQPIIFEDTGSVDSRRITQEEYEELKNPGGLNDLQQFYDI